MSLSAATQMGMVVGTAAYMSPEQAKGKVVDKRTDIWSFGVLPYEMLTGTSPFRGDDVSEVLAGILKDEPDWTALPADTPMLVNLTLRRCLIKDPEQRLHDVADARIDVVATIENSEGSYSFAEPVEGLEALSILTTGTA